MNIFDLLRQALEHFVSYFAQANKQARQFRRIEKRAIRAFRLVFGYKLNDSERLTDAQLASVFLPISQSTAEAYSKLIALGKNEKYSLLLICCWATELGKSSELISQPQIE